jgi:hypothetical protein
MDDSYVEEAERENGRPVSLMGVEPREPRGRGKGADDAVPRERLAALLPRLRRHDELDLETLAYHLQQSDATAADGYCHAAINEARSFLEALVMSMAIARQREPIGKFRKGKESKSGFRLGCLYLRELGFIDEEEEVLLQHVYGIASAKGSHHGVTDELWCRLARRMVGTTGRYLIHRYQVWTGEGCPGPVSDQGAVEPSAPSPAPVNGSWRHRLVRLLGLEATLADAPAAGSGNGRRWG